MNYREERERTIAELSRAGLPYHVITALLRHASTLHRLAEAQCSGDWPADNGDRQTAVCPVCDGSWAPSVIKGGPLAKAAHTRAGLKTEGRYAVTAVHGEGASVFHVVDTLTDEAQQPDIVYSHPSAARARAACVRRNTNPSACPDCRTEEAVRAALEPFPYFARFQGVLRL